MLLILSKYLNNFLLIYQGGRSRLAGGLREHKMSVKKQLVEAKKLIDAQNARSVESMENARV